MAGTHANMPNRPTFDGVSAARRRNMQANRSKNTSPEMVVRRLLHAMGYRYRIHWNLPGKPDISFPARRKAIEIRGCFWHGHGCQKIGQLPRSRTDYWSPKIMATQQRDKRNGAALKALGWEVIEVWECRVRAVPGDVADDLARFLGPIRASGRTGQDAMPGGPRPREPGRPSAAGPATGSRVDFGCSLDRLEA